MRESKNTLRTLRVSLGKLRLYNTQRWLKQSACGVCSSDTLGITKRARISFRLAGYGRINFARALKNDADLTPRETRVRSLTSHAVFIQLPLLVQNCFGTSNDLVFGNGRKRFSLDFRTHLLFMVRYSLFSHEQYSYLKWCRLSRANGFEKAKKNRLLRLSLYMWNYL